MSIPGLNAYAGGFALTRQVKTNNSTTALKASTERLYLSRPHLYKSFVKEVKRATPAIHRGNWLRMRAVSWTVRNFLEHAAGQRKVVINFGCG
jgi:hypothetical protein